MIIARYESIEKVFRVIKILTLMLLPVRKIAQETGLSTMTIYRIIAALKQAGVPLRRYEGESTCYTIGHYDLVQFLSKNPPQDEDVQRIASKN